MKPFITNHLSIGKMTMIIIMSIIIINFNFGNHLVMAHHGWDRWAGTVTDTDGNPLQAKVIINGFDIPFNFNINDKGEFSLRVHPTDRYVIHVEMPGYVPLSKIHTGRAIEDLRLQLKKAEVFDVDPQNPQPITDSRGTNISFTPNSIVDANGNPATDPVQVSMYTYDLETEEMPGDMSGVNESGEQTSMESAGAFFAAITDKQGNNYNLADGSEAEVSIPEDSTAKFPNVIPLWSYDSTTGLWKQEGRAVLKNGKYVGEVGHFSLWNFDIEKTDPACIKVTISRDYLEDLDYQVSFKTLRHSPTRAQDVILRQRENVLYNLPTNTAIEFYIPPTATKPSAIINTGSAWGGTGVPAHPYDACNAELELPIPVPIQYPDLVPDSVTFDDFCNATVGASNIGNADIITNFSFKMTTLPSGNIDQNWPFPTMPKQESTDYTDSIGIGAELGSTIRITVDSREQLEESNETNNTKDFPVPLHCQESTVTRYLSSSTGGTVDSIPFADEDILVFDPTIPQWSKYFNGSDVGLQSRDVDAFHILDDGNILLSLNRPHTIDNVKYDDSDIIKFTATSLGNNTKGSFSMYMDGSDVKLTTASEDIDAIAQLANGDILISTLGTARVTGVTARDEDLLRFEPTQLGGNTQGVWSLYLDGSDIKLSHRNEDIWAAWVDDSIQQVHLSTFKNYNADGLKGDSDNVLACDGRVGNNTSCKLSLEWDGDAHGLGKELVDGYSVGPTTALTVFSAAVGSEDTENTPELDDESEDILDDDEYIDHIYLPVISR